MGWAVEGEVGGSRVPGAEAVGLGNGMEGTAGLCRRDLR